jgi:hypothetical protein
MRTAAIIRSCRWLDTRQQHTGGAETAFATRVTDAAQIRRFTDRSLCHGTAGLLATARRLGRAWAVLVGRRARSVPVDRIDAAGALDALRCLTAQLAVEL